MPFDIVQILRSRPHQRHLAPQNVEKLRELIYLEAPQQAPDGIDAWIPRKGEPAGIRALIDVHGAELVHREDRAIQTDPLRAIKNGAATAQANDHRYQEESRQQ